METVVRIVTHKGKDKPSAVSGKTRYWRSQDGMNNIGRFVPDLTPRTPEEQQQAERERMYTRDQNSKVETEVNIQLGIFTLNNVAMEQLDERIYSIPEFKEVFGEAANLGCAPVKVSLETRYHCS